MAPPPSVSAPPAVSAQSYIKLRHLRFSSDKEKSRWERAIASVWKTPLGEMYSEYLFSPTEDHADLPLWARMLTERIFRDIHFINVRLGAIQVMTDDLYVSERMTADVNDRATILQGHLDQERIRLQQTANTSTLFNAVVSFIPALPMGWSAIREDLIDRIRLRLGRKVAEGLNPGFYRGPNVFSPYQVFNYWTVGYVVIGALEWLAGEYFYQSLFAPKDEVLLLSLDDLVTSMDLHERQTRWSFLPGRKKRETARP